MDQMQNNDESQAAMLKDPEYVAANIAAGTIVLPDCYVNLKADKRPEAEIRAENDALHAHLADENEAVKQIALRVIAFAGQLEAYGHVGAANEILTEILGGQVNAPDYFKLKAENDQLRADLEEVRNLYKSEMRSADKLARENQKFHNDLDMASGELMVPIPEPGTDMARLVMANRMLVHEIKRLGPLLDAARAIVYHVINNGRPAVFLDSVDVMVPNNLINAWSKAVDKRGGEE